MTNSRRYGYGSGWLLVTVLSCACLAACGDNLHPNENVPGSGDEAADAAITDGQAMGTDLANQAEAQLGPEAPATRIAHLGMILLALDQGEIDQAETLLELGSDAETLDFALLMRDQHTAHAAALMGLLSARKIAPLESPVSGALRTTSADAIAQLQGAPRAEVDFDYLQLQVEMHAAAGVLVERLIDLAPADAELLDFLHRTRDAIADHQSRAEAILRRR